MASHLSLVLDLAPAHWHRADLSLAQFLPQLLVFLNAHVALTHDNSLAVFAALLVAFLVLFAMSFVGNGRRVRRSKES